MSPVESDDLTDIIEPRGAEFVLLHSPDSAEDRPDYEDAGTFATREQAEAYFATLVDAGSGDSPSIAPT